MSCALTAVKVITVSNYDIYWHKHTPVANSLTTGYIRLSMIEAISSCHTNVLAEEQDTIREWCSCGKV
ncbi:hypothetical protein [Candidatus Ichthyocystis sparus]|uniref:hypothetical protein n=1 Tax=Candidatus Ichthyocystis sparus TaxID=1561004 RepID=UPI0011124835|nr:hypothetical protein [Candidatus Ichthyocystis sparus]